MYKHREMIKKIDLATVIISGIIMIPLLYFPISLDLSIFASAGKTIAEGGKIYVDYVDVKPPLIYYIFSLVYQFFSWETFFLRLFDYFWQIATVFSILIAGKKIFDNKYIPIASALVYAVSYINMNFENVTQCEGFIALPVVWSIYCFVEKQEVVKYQYFNGFLAGVISGMKYTFAVTLLPFIIYDILNAKNGREFVKIIIRQIIGFILALAIISLPFVDAEVRHGFGNLMRYLDFYANNPPLSIGYLTYSLKVIASFFGTKYSLLFTTAAFIAVFSILKIHHDKYHKEKRFLLLSLLLIFFFILSIFLERKYYFYHYIRFYIPLTMLSGAGIVYLLKAVFSKSRKSVFTGLILIILVMFALVFGPLPRFFNTSFAPYYFYKDKEKYHNIFDRSYAIGDIHKDQRYVAGFLINNVRESEKVLVMSNESNAIYQMANLKRTPKFALSSMYFGNGAPQDWKNDIIREVKETKWLIIQSELRQENFNGHNKTALESLQEHKQLRLYFLKNFEVIDTNTSLHIYKRKPIF